MNEGGREGPDPLGSARNPGDGTGDPAAEAVAGEIRRFLAGSTGRKEWLDVPAQAPLLRGEVALDSLTGTLLLRELERRFGVDVAAEDLNLDSLATLGTLASFVAGRRGRAPGPGKR